MELAPAGIEDAQKINEIKTEAYRDEKKRFGPWQSINQGPLWYHEEWYNNIDETKHLIDKYHYFKIIEGEEVVGCFWLHDLDEDTIKLEDFCILPDFQGKGIGFKALIEMETLFPGKKKWVLGTPFYSVRNHYLYEKAGYIKTGERAEGMVFLYEKCRSTS